MKILLLANVAATLLLTGLIWTIQWVHYPLFSRVGASQFTAYESAHMAAISGLVMPLMLAELFTAIALAIAPPSGIPAWVAWAGLGLVIIIWGVTAFVNVPQHAALASGFNEQVHHALVSSNWLRTMAWSIRSLIMLWITERLLVLNA